ncbi:MAG: AAA domain-containing protein [Eubacterium sp.]|nr:AAA domain-containing protein [Eubacterium sp.]
MEENQKNQVLEILDYWKLIEFLGQTDILDQSPDNKKIIEKIKKGEKTDADKVEIFIELFSPYINVEKQLEQDKENFCNYPSIGDKFHFCIGKIERNTIVEYLEKYIDNKNELPEIVYPKKSAIAWCSFKTDAEGMYIQNSFQLSPILWAIAMWNSSDSQINLNKDEYDKIVSKIDEELQDKNVQQFLTSISEEIYIKYIRYPFPNIPRDTLGFIEYNRYINEDTRNRDENPTDYSNLGKSFFLNDIIHLEDLIRDENFGDKSSYEKKVIAYILAGHEKSKDMQNLKRTIISPTESKEKIKSFFDNILNVSKAPMGKWPAKFMPALMQQVAVNIAIQQNDDAPIFSVNGPPGTGKTTLLKEIVASNIVDRAKLLVENGTNPDSLFEKHTFTKGPLEAYGNSYYKFAPSYFSIKNDAINNYSMLVTSCNNAAVENITIDLPKGKDILDSLEAASEDEEDVKKGLQEVSNLFDITKSDDIETLTIYGKSREEKDIYFTRYANNLLGTDDCWGLVSAPFGKRANIRKYCNSVLKPFIEDYKSNNIREIHKKKFEEVRNKFLQQYALVEQLKKELEQICDLAKSIPIDLQEMSPQDISRYIYENGSDKKVIEDINNLRDYQSKLAKYSKGENKMTPVDSEFIDQYSSLDVEISTKSQVTNPWFTAKYNREREKLFLYACKVHKEFVISSKCMRQNIINLMIAWNMFDDCGERMSSVDREAAMPYMLQSIFLLTPVISTTFASAQTFLGDVSKSGVIGTLIVDESGQAQPQMAIGSLFRCRKAIIVGDPKQIEPVVTAETDMIKQLLTSKLLASYKDKKISVQGFADYINPYGTFLGEDEEKEWVGCPLVVHRRCIDPMYTISNVLSYDGTMKQQTRAPKAEKAKTFIFEKSCWIDVSGNENSGAKDHFVKSQGEVVLKLLETKFKKDKNEIPNLFIITPFTSVKSGMINMIEKSSLYKQEPRVKKWLNANNIGTVHTFQGQGTDEVIFLLGCDSNSVGAANWVNKNIVNVAATRAKYRFYMVGDKTVWMCKPVRIARECTSEIISGENIDMLLSNTM